MFNKKLLFGLLAFSLLPMFSASASVVMDDESDTDLIYLRLGYQAMYVGQNKIDSAKPVMVTAGTTAGAASTATTGTGDYKPKYVMNFMGGSLGVGKSFGGEARAELEIAANSQVDIDNSDKMEYFNNTATKDAAFVNKGFKFGMAALNLYYDIDSGKAGFTPYIGGGIGVARVNFVSTPTSELITYPIALQFKAGMQMKLNNMLPVYLGYKLVYLVQKESSDSIDSFIPSAAPAAGTATATTAISTKLKSSYTLHNFDVGIMLVK